MRWSCPLLQSLRSGTLIYLWNICEFGARPVQVYQWHKKDISS